MGLTIPWVSSQGGDFNYDFNVSITEEQQRNGGVEYNYRRGGHAKRQRRFRQGLSRGDEDRPEPAAYCANGPASVLSFARTASSITPIRPMPGDWTGSGACTSGSTAPPKGRNEEGIWWRHHDRYEEVA